MLLILIAEHIAKLSYNEMLNKKRKVLMRPDFEGLIPDRDQLFFLEDSIVDKPWDEILKKCESKS